MTVNGTRCGCRCHTPIFLVSSNQISTLDLSADSDRELTVRLRLSVVPW